MRMATRFFKTPARLGSKDYGCANNRRFLEPWVQKSFSSSKFSSSATVPAASFSINGARPVSSSKSQEIKTLEYRHQRLDMEPIKLGDKFLTGENMDSLEFRRVVCKGIFDEGRSVYVGPRSRSISGVTENGYYVITPLMPMATDPDRGWVPRSWRDEALKRSDDANEPLNSETLSTKSSEQLSRWKFWSKKPEIMEDQTSAVVTPIEVIGVIRGSENPSVFVPQNDHNSSQWFYLDVPSTARALDLPESTIYIEDVNDDINPSKPYPVPKDVNTLIPSSVMPQDHLNYTFTWYSLSAAVTYMMYKRLKPKAGRR